MDLLLELFSEEIPARMQRRAADDLKRLVTDALVEAGLTYSGGRAFSTPRRLVLALSDLPKETRASVEERRGPRVDAPEKALAGFLRSTGLTHDQLEARDDRKGQVWFAVIRRPGRPAAEVVAEAVAGAVQNFPWPKSMRWGSGDLRWVRPLHSVLCLLSDEGGAEIVPVEIDGIPAGNATRGHRFMGGDAFKVRDFEDYAGKLEAAKVVLDPEERTRRIETDAATLAFAQGLEIVPDAGLLAEVSGLVEWPVVLMGRIDDAFLDLPPEVLRTSMREHQKFFSVRDPKSGRITHFITVANIAAPDDGQAILAGNGRVLSARLADARFFWENDLRTVQGRGMDGMAEMARPLEGVTFHAKLGFHGRRGTQAERVARIAALARLIAPKLGADADLAEQAARVAKADLASRMVYEFPELQGTMGRYYAAAAGLPEAVANAAEAHYRPLGPTDEAPLEPVGIAVALADKIDMLTSFWAIDEKPTGSKDPFALRRAALGVIRTVLERGLRLDLLGVFRDSADPLPEWQGRDAYFERRRAAIRELRERVSHERARGPATGVGAIIEETEGKVRESEKELEALARFDEDLRRRLASLPDDLLSFFADRLKVYLRDQGIRHDVIQACFELGGQDDLVLLVNRVRALQDFLGTEDGGNLLTAYRRAANIVAAEEKKDGVEYSGAAEVKFAELPAEHAIFAALDAAEPAIAKALAAEDFAAAMAEMARLRAPVDAFFDKVTVNADNPVTRRNRLCLLTRIRQIMQQVAIWDAIAG